MLEKGRRKVFYLKNVQNREFSLGVGKREEE